MVGLDSVIKRGHPCAAGFKEMDVDELNRCLDTKDVSLVLDVRTPEEFADGHVPGATNIPFEELSAKVREGQLDEYKTKPIAVICQVGSRSAQAAVRLSKVRRLSPEYCVFAGANSWVVPVATSLC